MNSFRVELLKSEWIAEVTRIHMQSLPDDFLPGLGADFLRDIFYPAAMNSPYGCVYAAVENDRPLGFVVITQYSARFFRSIVKDQFRGFIRTGLKTSFSSFRNFKKNLEVLASLFEKNVYEDFGEIYEIAVSPDRQGQGVGKALVSQSVEYLKEAQIPGIKIKTRKNNTSWIAFFQRSGWHLAQEMRLIGKEYVILSLKF